MSLRNKVVRPRILKAAGGQIDPFWAMYAQHNVASVKDILGEHRIGHLSGSVQLDHFSCHGILGVYIPYHF